MPSDWKSHAYDSRSPFWSIVPALENWTVSGAVVPEAGFADARTTGVYWPLRT